MISTKKQVRQLVYLLQAKGITDVVIAPGSRNGPLIHTLAATKGINCRSIVDERSAAYFATGLAQALQKPVAVVCSSGTAALNFSPAIAEAFYLGIPLIAISADRPFYWVNQGENQTIPQQDIYRDFCKKEISLPLGESETDLWYASRLINETLNQAITGIPGPVHINVPLEEPLHELTESDVPEIKVIEPTPTESILSKKAVGQLTDCINRSGKIMILPGQMPANSKLENALASFSEKTGAVVVKEHISNLQHPQFLNNADILMTSLLNANMNDFGPDLLITLGGTFVSKPLKQFLRKHKPQNHWHLSPEHQYHDTYQSLTRVLDADAVAFFNQLTSSVSPKNSSYCSLWKKKEDQVKALRNEFIKNAQYSDLTVFAKIMKSIPPGSVLHLGNSSPVRYALLCEGQPDVHYYGNRGTSGIDGSLSTAAGFASVSNKLNTIVLGDLSFFYDSNALWNKYIGNNLRIIVIHNGGGNIFGMIKGPSGSPAFREFFFTENNTSAQGIATTFGLNYFGAKDETELNECLNRFFDEQDKPALLEIFTDADVNTETFRGLFRCIKEA